MGDFKEHALFGLLFAVIIVYIFDEIINLTLIDVLAGSLAVFVGSILPDIDHKRSYVHRAVKSFTSISAGVLTGLVVPFNAYQRYVAGLIAFIVIYTLFSSIKLKHRGFTHTLTFCIIVTSLGVVLSGIFLHTVIPGFALGVGLLSHLLLDREIKF